MTKLAASKRSDLTPSAPAIFRSAKGPLGFSVFAMFLAGLAYEFSYFAELKLQAFEYLGPAHFFLSGLLIVGPPTMFLVIFGMLKKLFSKSIVEDDWLVIRKDLSDFSFEQEVWGARLAVVLSFLFLLCAHFGVPSMRFGYMYLFLMFGVSLLFIRSAFLAPTQSHAALLICFFLSWMMCAAAGGIDEARVSQALVPVRDDRIARIEIQDGHYNVMAKPQNWAPFSWVRRFLP